jgi:polyisoprenoid-binding protein YceI
MRGFSYLAAAVIAAAAPALAQPGPGEPQPAMHVSKDPAAASAGTYALDTRHVGVIVSVTHAGGFSYSIFRMNEVQGALIWDPARLEQCQVTARIAANSLTTNVPGFGDELTGPRYLDSAKFPAIAFASTSIKRTGPTTGLITGNLTLHGVTRPVTLDTTLIGAGQGRFGQVVGFSAKAHVSRIAFGIGPPDTQNIGDNLEIAIDLEFDKAT